MGKSPPRRPHEIIIIIPKFISKFYIKVNRISGPTTLIHYEKLDLWDAQYLFEFERHQM